MCCFRLHFSDINVLFFKNIKTCCGLLLKKITSCAKKEKKATCARKNPNLPWISNGPSPSHFMLLHPQTVAYEI